MTTCGWQSNELVNITIEMPDGTSISETKQAGKPDFGLSFSYETELTDPPGIYTFVFEGESGTVQRAIEIEMPTEPRLYLEDEGRSFF